MKKIVYKKPGCVVIEEDEIPKLKEHEVLVEVQCVSLCGSDYKLYNGTYDAPHTYPLVMGHEWSGIIVTVNDDENEFHPGDRVTGECSMWCGKCPNCQEDKNLCAHIEKFGITRDGFAAQYQIMDRRFLHKAETQTDYDVLALAEPLAVALHGIQKIRKVCAFTGKKAAIIGGGSIGVCIYLLLKNYYKIKDVVIFETDKEKAIFLRETFDAEVCSDNMLWENGSYQSIYQKQEFDMAFEASGTSNGIITAAHLLKIQGNLCLYGLGKDYQADMKIIVLKGLHVTGTIGGSGEFETVVQFIGENSERIRKLITKRYCFKEIKTALEHTPKENEPVLKQQIYFRKDENNRGKR
ncbi:alcohol dehydrogenase catalytic domain-containing protein [Clostridium sp. KNHs205]|jgi:L-iditol 2-dehydrogenase|uniref:zinc-dependent alcohol dehydrogenase n=1 Tax=Clostridium sp. KNHs205 TaxID=1449050 RepID=UPI00068C099A|nr:alcohol dehydrogenase catalytic domain-containing protein [Clostridium sp. KNHs205]